MRGIDNQNLIDKARQLRKTQTPWEDQLWYLLRNRRFKEYKFRRQYPIGNYIVDFICIKRKIVIELDGSGHLQSKSYDAQRDNFLRGSGYQIIRFWNNELESNLEGVSNKIYEMLK